MKRRNVIHLHAKTRSGAGAHHDDDRAERANERIELLEAKDEARAATCPHPVDRIRRDERGAPVVPPLLVCLDCGAFVRDPAKDG